MLNMHSFLGDNTLRPGASHAVHSSKSLGKFVFPFYILLFWQESVPLAVQFVENEIRRLLEGGCELSEMVMTGGLWRITGKAS